MTANLLSLHDDGIGPMLADAGPVRAGLPTLPAPAITVGSVAIFRITNA